MLFLGDYNIADYIREKWATSLDDSWFINYDIMHQYPVDAESYSQIIDSTQQNQIQFELDKREKNITDPIEDVLMTPFFRMLGTFV